MSDSTAGTDNTNIRQTADVGRQTDNFNRTDLYNGLGNQGGAGGAAKPGDVGAAKGGVNQPGGDIDFNKAGNIYGAQAQNAGMSGSSKESQGPGTGDSATRQPGQQGQQFPEDQKGQDSQKDRFGRMSDEAKADHQGGVAKIDDAPQGKDNMSPNEMEARRDQKDQPFNDGQATDLPSRPVTPEEPASNDRTLATVKDGKTNDVSSYDTKNNKLTDYKLDNNGDVASRTTTDFNNNSTDNTNFGPDGRATSRQVSQDGGPAQDAPTDPHEQVSSIVGQDGKVQSIESTRPDGSDKISLGADGKPTSTDSTQVNENQSSTQTHTNLNDDGTTNTTSTKNYEANGRLRTSTTEDHGYEKTETYNGQVTRTDENSEYRRESTVNTPDGTATATLNPDGTKELSSKGTDGSSTKWKQDGETGKETATSVDNQGNIHQSEDFEGRRKDIYKEKATGDWGFSNTNKNTNTSKKGFGGPGYQTNEWVEHQI
jgi:hypothetical protein